MTPEQAATWQAWAGAIQAAGAIAALIASVAIPYAQRRAETKLRLTVKEGFAYPFQERAGIGFFFFEDPQSIRPYLAAGKQVYLAVAIANKASFPIPIRDVGLTHQKRNGVLYGLAPFVAAEPFGNFPSEIRPMESAVIGFEQQAIKYCHNKRARIYVRMVDREIAYSKPGAWWGYKEILQRENHTNTTSGVSN